MHLYVFLSDSYVIKVIRENDEEVTLQPEGTDRWIGCLSIDEIDGKYAVVDLGSRGLWIFQHDGM